MPAIDAIELLGNLVIAFYVLRALKALCQRASPEEARLLVAEGAVNGLSFKLAATLLKTLMVHSWLQIQMLAIIVSLRILLKSLFTHQKARLIEST